MEVDIKVQYTKTNMLPNIWLHLTHTNRGTLVTMVQWMTVTLQSLGRAIDLVPDMSTVPTLRVLISEVAQVLGWLKEAREILKHALFLDPQATMAQTVLELIRKEAQ